MQFTLPKRDIVLLGVGHTNAHVLRMWRMQPLSDVRLTCVSNFSHVTYSGMLPGVLSGQYEPEQMQIDLVRACSAAGARLVLGNVTGLDRENRQLLFTDRPPLPFDMLSIGIGSAPSREGVAIADDAVLPIKPMQSFLQRLESRLRSLTGRSPSRPRIAVVGGGAAGIEITFCLPARIQQLFGASSAEQWLVDSGPQIASGFAASTRRRIALELAARHVNVLTGRRVRRVDSAGIEFEDGERLEVDLVLWATSATAPPLLSQLGLPTDERGFVRTRSTLQSVAEDAVFAVGDAGTIDGAGLPKAGVYAVRQGPVLWENLRRHLAGEPLVEYRPQRDFLKLLNLGNGRAIAEFRGRSLAGRWCWRLKNYIDSRFMAMYQDYRPAMPAAPTGVSPPSQIRCAGCGGKISGSVLSRVLSRLEIPPSEHVLLGLDKPDDAAVIRPPGGRPVCVTVDYFAAPLDDPYLVGRLTALHSLSDVFALGARPFAALAMATLPLGPPRQQEQLLYELLAGSLEEFRRLNTTLVGGHTIEGPQLAVGFTILADQGSTPPLTKDGLRPGDRLLLTKPLGTGVLLAANMQTRCSSDSYDELLRTMLLSNAAAGELARELSVTGLTDVTGFGLAGHLGEMLRASGVSARLTLADVPLLPGVKDLLRAGLESTLAPANRAAEAFIDVPEAVRQTPAYAALFDPQTCGGMLLGVPDEKVDIVLRRLREQSDVPCAVIGDVLASDGPPRLVVT